jgi:hypothetical protein
MFPNVINNPSRQRLVNDTQEILNNIETGKKLRSESNINSAVNYKLIAY